MPFLRLSIGRLLTTSWILVLSQIPPSWASAQDAARPKAPPNILAGAHVGNRVPTPPQLKPHRLKYRSADLAVDLGVGLWAWPLPMDWDQDGDLDLVVSCPDVPFNGTYFFENTDGNVKMPVFRPPVRIGPAVSNATLSYVDGAARVLSAGREMVDFRVQRFARHVPIHTRVNVHENKVRANQWRYVDLDGDRALDLIVGVGDWTDYGWDNAYDLAGHWTRGPLHGYVYWLRNQGTTEAPTYAPPVKLEADGKPIDVYGMPSPNFADFDGDGDLDLVCGEFLDSFTYFTNVGTRDNPRYAAPRKLQFHGQPIHMDLQMIVPVAIDWDRDGDVDLISGDEDGRVALIEHTGKTIDGMPAFLPPKYFQQQADHVKFGALVTPVSVDWDGDGDEDLICGNSAGYIALIENLDGGAPPRWAPPRRLKADDGKAIRIQAGVNGSIQGPCEAKWGYTTINVADWNHDGRLDIVLNSIWGRVEWCENVGSPNRPKLKPPRPVFVDWPAGVPPPKPAWNWWKPKPNELATQWRTTPLVIDLDKDQLNDLVMLDHEGYLAFYRRARDGNRLILKPGERIFTDAAGRPLRLNAGAAGRSGRRKLCFADWDGDGRLDLLVNSRNVNLLRNVSTPDRPWSFQDVGPLDTRRLAGHTTSPTVVDWNRDGRPDLLIGAEDGHFYYQPNTWTAPRRRETARLILETRHVEEGILDNGARAFANRNYTWVDVPSDLRGWQFTRTHGGVVAFVTVEAKMPTTVFMAISRGHKGVALDGWKRIDGRSFAYTDSSRSQLDVFVRELAAGQRIIIPQGTWSGGLLLIPPRIEPR